MQRGCAPSFRVSHITIRMGDVQHFACGGISPVTSYGSDCTGHHVSRQLVSYHILLSWQVFHVEVKLLNARSPSFKLRVLKTFCIEPLKSSVIRSKTEWPAMKELSIFAGGPIKGKTFTFSGGIIALCGSESSASVCYDKLALWGAGIRSVTRLELAEHCANCQF